MAYSNLYVKILIFLLANLVTQQNVHCNEYDEWGIYPQSKHSLKKPYSYEWESTTIINNVNWELVGNALAHRSFIRLTEDRANQAGGVWNTLPIKFYNWEVQIDFNISGSGKVYGDGMAFWYVHQPLHQDHYAGHVYGSTDFFTGLGIFLDTYPNKFHSNIQYPYISAMANNGSYSYNMDIDGKTTELSGCHSAIRNVHGRASMSIQYYEGLLKVRTDVEQRNRWTLCFASRLHLPAGYYIGVTASTNYLSDNHDIIELRTYRIDKSPPTSRDDRTVLIVLPKGSAPHSTLSLFLVVLSFSIIKLLAF